MAINKIIFIITLFLFSNIVYSEGTKQLMKTASSKGKLSFYKTISDFACYDAPEDYRLNIHIANLNEKIYLGFGNTFLDNNTSVKDISFRVKDPSGQIIYQESIIPQQGETGYINNYDEAVEGPKVLSPNGYTPIIISPKATGDYFIEFNSPDTENSVIFELFDISVINNQNKLIEGRLWSKAWQLYTGNSEFSNPENDPFQNEFDGKMYVYTTDQIVSSIDFNGMKPLGFSVFCNSFGLSNTNNFIQDRKSKEGNIILPEYKIFLNNPDPIIYPSNNLNNNFKLDLNYIGKTYKDFNFTINAPFDGTAEINLDLNNIPGFQEASADIQLYSKIKKGLNYIPWNGINGLGVQMPDSFVCNISYQYISGLTNLPLYDVERNENGIIVEIIRPTPTNPYPLIFWDDTELLNGAAELNGCSSTNGCHIWNGIWNQSSQKISSFGNNNTINTWWYSGYSNVEILNFLIDLNIYKIENYIPNVITPNDDNINDAFTIRGIDYYPGSSLKIFNRWGKLIYIDDNYNSTNYWRGTNMQGQPVPNGTYYYILEVNNYKNFNGYITLINN